jgi:hypothetical protein
MLDDMAAAGLGRTIPALPVRDVPAAVTHVLERFGFSVRIETHDVDGLCADLRRAGVLRPVSQDGVTVTDSGTREFATLDRDGNLLSLHRWA